MGGGGGGTIRSFADAVPQRVRRRPDPLTTSEHSDRGCGEADSAADTGHRTEAKSSDPSGPESGSYSSADLARDTFRPTRQAKQLVELLMDAPRRYWLAPSAIRGCEAIVERVRHLWQS